MTPLKPEANSKRWCKIGGVLLNLIGMNSSDEELPLPDFEIDHQDVFGQFMLSSQREIIFYLNLLAKRRAIFTAYINEGQQFFLTSIIAVDEATNMVCFDPSLAEDSNAKAKGARQITLVANLDRVKMEMRFQALNTGNLHGRDVLTAPIPPAIMRLQRREFFRLEPPRASPLFCKLAVQESDGRTTTLSLALSDISGGGVSLIAATEAADYFPRDALLQQCRLEIPGEGVIQVNLRVRKTIEVSGHNGEHQLRVGCEFIGLQGTRLALIERYITRIERERKARSAEIVDQT